LFETLALGRALGLETPDEVVLVCVEVADALTIGGEMTAPVRAALPEVVEVAASLALESMPALEQHPLR
jgi:Ni,Fe-hydrogenase maturation factor